MPEGVGSEDAKRQNFAFLFSSSDEMMPRDVAVRSGCCCGEYGT